MSDAVLREFCQWLAATPLSHAIQTAGWVIPALQIIHILGVAVIFSSAIIVDLRIWRVFQREVPLPDIARRFLPMVWPVLLVLVVTGSLLIIGEPRRSLLNTTFYLKMALLAVALALTGALQWSLSSAPEFWQGGPARPMTGRLAATLSILAWCSILFAGRWIAYTQVG